MTDQEVDHLISLYNSGNLAEAQKTANELIKNNPNNAILPNILGACYFALGNINEAINSYRNAINISPNYVEAHSNLGVAFLALNDLENAIYYLKNAIRLNNEHADSYSNLGLVYIQKNEIKLAEQNFLKAIDLQPEHAQAHKNLGDLKLTLKAYEEAISSFNAAIKYQLRQWEVYNNLGISLMSLGRASEAAKVFQESLKINPKSAETQNNLGTALAKLSKPQSAVECFREALSINPTYAQAYTNLGKTFLGMAQYDEAEECFLQALQVQPNHVAAYFALGNLFRKQNKVKDAIISYEKAIEIRPNYLEAYNNLGNLLVSIGKFNDARTSYEAALKIKPDYALAHRHLSNVKKYNANDSQIEILQKLILNPNTNKKDRIALSYALAKAFDDSGKYEDAFSYYKLANRENNELVEFNILEEKKEFSNIKNISIKNKFISLTQQNSRPISQIPIFIIGMPRSGTTLVEQILASHSKVFGAGELPFMNKLCNSVFQELNYRKSLSENKNVSLEKLISIRNKYTQYLDDLNANEVFITDKLPINFKWIELILNSIPEAKIIHVKRDPKATCWSIYKTFFSKGGNKFSYDMDHIIAFYKMYKELMELWDTYFGDKIYTIKYENIVNDQANQTRHLLTYCDLNWEDRCLEFYETERTVETASQTQVRRKIYDEGINSWKNYKPYIQELISGLDIE